jgi:hypothetical protein
LKSNIRTIGVLYKSIAFMGDYIWFVSVKPFSRKLTFAYRLLMCVPYFSNDITYGVLRCVKVSTKKGNLKKILELFWESGPFKGFLILEAHFLYYPGIDLWTLEYVIWIKSVHSFEALARS